MLGRSPPQNWSTQVCGESLGREPNQNLMSVTICKVMQLLWLNCFNLVVIECPKDWLTLNGLQANPA